MWLNLLNLASKARDLLIVMGIISSVLVFFTRVGWAYWGDSVSTFFRTQLGINTLEVTISALQQTSIQTQENLQEVTQKMSLLYRQIDSLRPRKVLEFDEIRSRIEPNQSCSPGTWCNYSYRYRFTEQGLGCILTEVQPRVINHGGLIHSSRIKEKVSEITGDSQEWAVIEGSFLIPLSAQPGIGQFYFELKFNNCTSDNIDGFVKQSFPLVFTIKDL